MASCEYCWVEADRRGIDYKEMLAIAEREGAPCCERIDGVVSDRARRARAGQFWDDASQSDRRHSNAT